MTLTPDNGIVRSSFRWLVPAFLGILVTIAPAAATDRFPELRPTTRAQAVELFRADVPAPRSCETLEILTLPSRPFRDSGSRRLAFDLLRRRNTFSSDDVLNGPEGIAVRYTTSHRSADRVAPVDRDGSGRPDLLDTLLGALGDTHGMLVGRVELPGPAAWDVLVVELGDEVDGYLVPGGPKGSGTLAIDATPRCGLEGSRQAMIRLYAHAIAFESGPAFPREWADALAAWTVVALDGVTGPHVADRLNRRIATLGEGLPTLNPGRSAGNAIWFAFLDEAYGPGVVRATVEELSSGQAVGVALDRALQRGAQQSLDTAFREFQLWTLFVGDRADGHHFSFAPRLAQAAFASVAEGLPALSVQSDPAVAALGAAQIRLVPERSDGGMRLVFDGEFAARWEADVLLFRENQAPRRVPVRLSSDNRGEITVPLGGVSEAILLVRNLGSEDGFPHRYTYSVHAVQGFPFELAAFEATPVDDRGVVVAWQTSAEQQLLGFNVVRTRGDDSIPVVINPVWMPAMGEDGRTTSYQFLDATAEPGTRYVYRIQGITQDGLTGTSEPIELSAGPR